MAYGPWELGGLSYKALVKRVWNEINDDNVWDAAAQLGYYFLLAVFPLLIVILNILSLIPAVDIITSLLATLRDVMPEQAYSVIGREIGRMLTSASGGLLTFGMIGAIWAASTGVVSLIGVLNRAYEVEEGRGWFKLRGIAIALTFALVALLVLGSALLTAGDAIAGFATSALGLDAWATITGTIINYALGLVLLFGTLELIYYFGPNRSVKNWHWFTPGSAGGVIVFLSASIGFSLYVRYNNSYSVTYGSIGAVIVLMLWLYLLGLSILFGAEINSEIEKARAESHEDAKDRAPERKRAPLKEREAS